MDTTTEMKRPAFAVGQLWRTRDGEHCARVEAVDNTSGKRYPVTARWETGVLAGGNGTNYWTMTGSYHGNGEEDGLDLTELADDERVPTPVADEVLASLQANASAGGPLEGLHDALYPVATQPHEAMAAVVRLLLGTESASDRKTIARVVHDHFNPTVPV